MTSLVPAQTIAARQRHLHLGAATALLALIVLTLVWELALAPLRPGGSWLALKTLPLLMPLSGVIRGRIYTYRWASMLVLAYFAEGVVRAYAERGMVATLSAIEIALSIAFFASAIAYVRVARSRSGASTGSGQARSAPPS
jgi:uncharacterized membrane protein